VLLTTSSTTLARPAGGTWPTSRAPKPTAATPGGSLREPIEVMSMTPEHARRAAAGGSAVLAAVALGPVIRATLLVSGGVLLVRALANLPRKRPLGAESGGGAVSVRKRLTVGAPVGEVFELWSRPVNFPRFMGHVEEVQPVSDRRSRWTVRGAAGMPVHWQTELVAAVPNELIAWRTVAGSPVEHAGIVRFQPTAAGDTRIDVRLSYAPPAGPVGHGVAAALGVDPERAMDQDLVRLKSLLETGQTRAHGPVVRREEVA
jgi:uncharacterized membrane protein